MGEGQSPILKSGNGAIKRKEKLDGNLEILFQFWIHFLTLKAKRSARRGLLWINGIRFFVGTANFDNELERWQGSWRTLYSLWHISHMAHEEQCLIKQLGGRGKNSNTKKEAMRTKDRHPMLFKNSNFSIFLKTHFFAFDFSPNCT